MFSSYSFLFAITLLPNSQTPQLNALPCFQPPRPLQVYTAMQRAPRCNTALLPRTIEQPDHQHFLRLLVTHPIPLLSLRPSAKIALRHMCLMSRNSEIRSFHKDGDVVILLEGTYI